MFEGIYLWDAKYGVPTDQSIKQAEQSEVATFIDNLEATPFAQNDNLHHFAVFFDAFMREASPFFEDEAFDYVLTKEFPKGTATKNICYMQGIPREGSEHYWSVLLYGARLHNLNLYWTVDNQIVTPEQGLGTEASYQEWKDYHAKLLQAENSDEIDSELPETMSQVDKLVAKILKEKLKELGVNKFKVTSKDVPTVTIKSNKITLRFSTMTTIDDEDKWQYPDKEYKMKFWTYPYIYICVDGIGLSVEGFEQLEYFDIELDYFSFYKTTGSVFRTITNKTVGELKKNINQSLDMLMYFYPHIGSLDSLYDFFMENREGKELARYYFSSNLYHIDQRMLYGMATLLGKPNLTELTTQFRQEYIADKLYALEEEKKEFEAEEDRLEKEDSNYKRYSYIMPENPEAEYAQEFDDYVAGLTQGE